MRMLKLNLGKGRQVTKHLLASALSHDCGNIRQCACGVCALETSSFVHDINMFITQGLISH